MAKNRSKQMSKVLADVTRRSSPKFHLQKFLPRLRHVPGGSKISGVLGRFRQVSDVKEISALFDTEKNYLSPTSVPSYRSQDEAVGTRFLPTHSPYPKYPCDRGNPLNCPNSRDLSVAGAPLGTCPQCGFPGTIPANTKVQGDFGTYRIEELIGWRGMGRLYAAEEQATRQPFVVKEYVLPQRYFNDTEARSRQQAFANVAGLELADGRVQDYRILTPIEAIADPLQRRCYLVTPTHREAAPSLKRYLAETGAMSQMQVRQLLQQGLQSLEALHSQKFRLPSGLVRSQLVHGNLNLDTVLVVPTLEGFFFYLCDLNLWERLFDPPLSPSPMELQRADLADLGYLAFYALSGGNTDVETGDRLDPRLEVHWREDIDPALQQYILGLILGGDDSPFARADSARQALPELPIPEPLELPSDRADETASQGKSNRRSRLWWWILGILGVVLLAALIGWLAGRSRQQTTDGETTLSCCIDRVSGIPAGQFRAIGVSDSSWSYAWRQANLIAKGVTLAQELYQRQPDFTILYRTVESAEEAIAQVINRQVDFAIAAFPRRASTDIGYREFAYDGLVAYVAFSYAKRDNSLPQALRGKISFAQLRQLYTGEIANWRLLGGPDLPVRLYAPTDREAIRIFEERVLQDEGAISSFRQLLRASRQENGSISRLQRFTITSKPTFETLSAVLRDFEDREIGSISFGTMSKIFGQCSVYPLALTDDAGSTTAPLVRENGNPIAPTTDLCNDKGSYFTNADAFRRQRYPLAYPLAVAYFRDNRQPPAGEKFAAMLRTVEVQQLLQQTGLIPVRSLEGLHRPSESEAKENPQP